MPYLCRAFLCCIAVLLSACGGGGAGNSAAGNNSTLSVSLPPSTASLRDANVAKIVVGRGPGNNVNIPYVSVTVCTAGGVVGSSNCKTIDNVLLDTGSTGLRLFASQVNAAPALVLPAQTVGVGAAVFECANFLNNNAWGSVKVADVVIAGERAPSVPIQLMDANNAGVGNCGGAPLFVSATETATGSTQKLSANGILGLGLFTNDGQNYFSCAAAGTACRAASPAASQQVQNPVHLFGVSGSNGVANNNGVVLQLPSLSPSGAAGSAEGYLIFGVNTQSNNSLGSAHVVPVNSSGFFTTVYRGTSVTRSFIDSGSNGLYFADPAPAVLAGTCRSADAGFYCPSATANLNASIQLATSTVTVNFSIGNADDLFRVDNYAFDSLGGSLGSGLFDWGLPFFFGRSVYTVIEGTRVGALTGPFYAFTN